MGWISIVLVPFNDKSRANDKARSMIIAGATDILVEQAGLFGLRRARDLPRSEFSDIGALSGRLSRSQAKETTLDYARPAEAFATWQQRGMDRFAARRGMEERDTALVPEARAMAMGARSAAPAPDRAADRQADIPAPMPVPEHSAAPAPPPRKRGMFDGLKLDAGRARPDTAPSAFAGVSMPARSPGLASASATASPPQVIAPEGLGRAVERYARAWTDAGRMEAAEGIALKVR